MAEAEVVAALREYCLMKFDMKALARDCCRDGTAKRRFLQEGDIVPRPGVQRVPAPRAGLRVRAGDEGRRLPVNTPVLTAKAIRSLK